MTNAERYKQGNCTICEKWFPLLHWHHTVPQACGGKDSLQIPLCASCHNILHAQGLDEVGKLKNPGRKSSRIFWANPTMENNAGPYLKILVEAIRNDELVRGKLYTMMFKAPPALHTALQLYKLDSNAGSLEKSILLALSEFMRHRGYLDNEQHSARNQQQGKNGAPRSQPDLW